MSSKKPPGDSLLAVDRVGLGGSRVLILASMLSGWITHPHAKLSMSELQGTIA